MAERTAIWVGLTALLGVVGVALLAAVGTAQQPNWTSIPAFVGYSLFFLAGLILVALFISAIRQGTSAPVGQLNPITVNIGSDSHPRPGDAQDSGPPQAADSAPRVEPRKHQTVRLAELVEPGMAPLIRGVTFEDCVIQGPAVVHINRSDLIHSRWAGSPTEAFIESDAEVLQGVIGLDRCAFIRCEFDQIALIGTRDYLDYWRAGFGLKES